MRKAGSVNIPSCIKIGPHDFQITQDEIIHNDREVMGRTDSNICKIQICLKLKEGKIPESQIADTFLHETIHAIDHIFELGLREKQIRSLSSALLATIRDNKLDFLDKNTYTS